MKRKNATIIILLIGIITAGSIATPKIPPLPAINHDSNKSAWRTTDSLIILKLNFFFGVWIYSVITKF